MEMFIAVTKKSIIDYIFTANPFFVLGVFVCSIVILCIIKKKSVKIDNGKILAYSSYLTLLITITLLGRPLGGVNNTWKTLFSTYEAWIIRGEYWQVYEVIYNALLFVPLGVILKKVNINNKRCMIYVAIISFTIETVQLILGVGLFEISDLVNNTLGGAIGVCIVIVHRKVFDRYTRENNREIAVDKL